MKSILVIRLTSLGDVVLATPIVRMLQRVYPEASIDVAVDERFAEVWNKNPHVHHVYAVANGGEHHINAQPYDLVVDLQRNRRSGRIIKRMREAGSTRVLQYPKHRLEKLALVYCKRKPKNVTHIVQRYAEPLRELGLSIDSGGLELWPQPGEPLAQEEHTDQQRRLRIGIAPGAQHETKRYPAVLMAKVVRHLVVDHGAEVVLLGGKADVALCDEIGTASGLPVTRADGATTIEATVRVLDTLDAVVSCDSAIVHMSAARSLPVVVVYGSTAPEFGFTPYGVPHMIVQAEDVACRPCTHIGRSSCPKGHFHCMNTISPLQLANEAMTLAMKNVGS
jgi:ADP-heptose:LPS heptosyltransferase